MGIPRHFAPCTSPVQGMRIWWGCSSTIVETPGNGSESALSETLAGSGNAWEAANIAGRGTPKELESDLPSLINRAATSAEVTSGFMSFGFGADVASAIVQIRTAAGVVKAWDGAITLSGRAVRLSNAGSVDWANTDIVSLSVSF